MDKTLFDISPVLVSVKTASAAFVITFFAGLFTAQALSRLKNRTLKTVLDSLLTLPLVLPPTVAGFFLLLLFGVEGPLGKILLDFFAVKMVFSWSATVLAAVVIAFPLMYRSARGALEQVDPVLHAAAQTLGISEWRIFLRIILPAAFPGIGAGGILAFARGIGEFGATAMIAGNIAGKTRTLPLAIYAETAAGNTKLALQYVIIMMILSFIIVILMNGITARRTRS